MKRTVGLKSIWLFILGFLMIGVTSSLGSGNASAADVTLDANTRQGLQSAVTNAGSTPTTIYITDNITFYGIPISVPTTANITIKSDMGVNGSPFTLTQSNARHFTVNGSLTLEDIVLDSTGSTSVTTNRGGVTISTSSSSFTMNHGATVQNCYNSNTSTVAIDNGTFTMNGGTIQGNTAVSAGGGVYVNNNGTFNMNGGNITNNTALGSNNAGSGVFVRGTFSMYGGQISNNSAPGSSAGGGGVCVYNNGRFYMGGPSGGGSPTISNNTSTNLGGGVYVQSGTFTMHSGRITGNTSISGGGIYVTSGSRLDVTGTNGTPYITDNHASGNGGGIYTANTAYANLTTAGNTVFRGNTASALYRPPTDAAGTYPNIGFSEVSLPGVVDHPLNNYDINFIGTRINKYTITVLTDGFGTAKASEAEAFPGTEITLTATPYNGFHLKEWQVVSGGITIHDDRFIMPAGNVIIRAVFDIVEKLVMFESNGGSVVPSQLVPYGGRVARPPDPMKHGFIFDGWFTDNGTFANPWDFENDTVTNNMTLYAKWTNTPGALEPTIPPEPEEPTAPPESGALEPTVPPEPGEPTAPPESGALEPTIPPESGNLPKTGDDNDFIIWIITLLTSLTIIGFLSWIAYKKKVFK